MGICKSCKIFHNYLEKQNVFVISRLKKKKIIVVVTMRHMLGPYPSSHGQCTRHKWRVWEQTELFLFSGWISGFWKSTCEDAPLSFSRWRNTPHAPYTNREKKRNKQIVKKLYWNSLLLWHKSPCIEFTCLQNHLPRELLVQSAFFVFASTKIIS